MVWTFKEDGIADYPDRYGNGRHHKEKKGKPRKLWNAVVAEAMRKRQLTENEFRDKEAQRLGYGRRPREL